MSATWMIVGLGNPGAKYERNRHNVGFRVVDELAGRHGFGALRAGKLGGDTASGMLQLGGTRHKAILLEPMEYMNLSGYAVQRTAQFHDIEVERIVVIHDEIDLDFGVVRLKKAGGHGGHNGLRSITEQLGTADFLRVRVGVGRGHPAAGAGPRPTDGDAAARPKAGPSSNVAGWVLSDFPSAVATQVAQLIAASADGAEAIVARGIGPAMNEFNGKAPVGQPASA